MDPLTQLKDIHLPEQVHQWPIAIGWWLLLTALIILLIIAMIKIVQKRKLLADKKQAMKLLNSTEMSGAQVIATLKWLSIRYFQRGHVAKLHGKAFADFLISVLPEKKQALIADNFPDLLIAHYRNADDEETLNELKQQAILWINCALPPKAETKTMQLEPVQ
ncbi:DUF4381 domain-containing protein [Thalassotalea sp. 1_MG-2023]|uniref:DUF4381 domain-containing protein n=1 Tax=Thalassotalea sp. 1_MG-2023 TaxID=3062680 RepID=UPI0026E134AC|nr:DUF4381 domain-containing protein [Thalassotalea sp. 1_MG-2023]MDO6426540.1 DUF4381 domain-containing protein [Thalassotalea sp. 1_MG-2023]